MSCTPYCIPIFFNLQSSVLRWIPKSLAARTLFPAVSLSARRMASSCHFPSGGTLADQGPVLGRPPVSTEASALATMEASMFDWVADRTIRFITW